MKENSNTPPEAPGYFTRVKNRTIEAWSLFPFFNNTARVYFVILRLTLGYHREWSKISRKEFQKRTGIGNEKISRSLQRLEQCKTICRKGHTNNVNYKINQHFTTWKKPKKTLRGKLYVEKAIQSPAKRPYSLKKTSYSMVLNKKKESKTPFSFSDLEKSKDQKDRDFFETFKDYPKLTNWKKGLEIFRTDVEYPDALDKIKTSLARCVKHKNKTGEYYSTLGKFMVDWADYHDEHERESKGRKAADTKQKEVDDKAAAEHKRINNMSDEERKSMTAGWRKKFASVAKDARAKKKGG
ncbi:hypothetical protein ES703_97243 [subsurface metagenome]